MAAVLAVQDTPDRPEQGPVPARRAVHSGQISKGCGAIAVLLVIAAHAGLGLFQGGFCRCRCLFCPLRLSDLPASCCKRTTRAQDLARGFYARRVRRILPAGTLVLLPRSLPPTSTLAHIERPISRATPSGRRLFAANSISSSRAPTIWMRGLPRRPCSTSGASASKNSSMPYGPSRYPDRLGSARRVPLRHKLGPALCLGMPCRCGGQSFKPPARFGSLTSRRLRGPGKLGAGALLS